MFMTWYEMCAHWTASETKAVFTWLPLLLTETCRNCHVQLVTKVHVKIKISEGAAKADVNTDSFVIQQWSNPMKRTVYSSWNEILASWLRQNVATLNLDQYI